MLLEMRDVRKSYGKVVANDGIDLAVDTGEVYGLLGHNGAGKTTLVNQVVGLLRPDSGSIRIDEHDVIADAGLARRLSSVQPQAQVPIAGLTPRQAIDLVGRLRGGNADTVRNRTVRIAEELEIGEWLDVDGARLSGGVKRLVSFCMAAVAPGKLVILDEPTNDVDPVRRRLLWKQVRALADEGAGVLLVTHNVVEAERSVDRLAILDHGRVIAAGTPAELKDGMSEELRLELVLEPAAQLPAAPAFIRVATASGNRVACRLPAPNAGEAATWARDLVRAGLVEEFSLAPATLEDVYISLVESGEGIASATSGDQRAVGDGHLEEQTDVRAA